MRFVPILLLVSGVASAVKTGPQLAEKIVDTVRIVMVRYEANAYATQLATSCVLGEPVPKPNNPGELSGYINANATAAQGRDPAIDLWGQPYRLEKTGPQQLLLLSTGPNGNRDACKDAEPPPDLVKAAADADQILKAVQQGGVTDEVTTNSDGKTPGIDPQGALDKAIGQTTGELGNDDVCVPIECEHSPFK